MKQRSGPRRSVLEKLSYGIGILNTGGGDMSLIWPRRIVVAFRICASACLALMIFVQLSPTPALAYDASWYKTSFWAGEWPHGFTLKNNTTILIRTKPKFEEPRTIDCALTQGATFHPWNNKRVASSKLEFISFVPIITFVITKPISLTLSNEQTELEEKLSFSTGDEWKYLTYYAEGHFRMKFNGKIYGADQDLLEASNEKTVKNSSGVCTADEWMKLTCANGNSGWLLLKDVQSHAAFADPEISEYGKAADKH